MTACQPNSSHDDHPYRQAYRSIDFQGDTATIERIIDESSKTISHQLDAQDDYDRTAISIVRLNGVLLSLIVGLVVVSVHLDQVTATDIANEFTAVGILALLVSSITGAWVVTLSKYIVGIDTETIEQVMDADLREEEFSVLLAQSYAHWIEHNDDLMMKNTPLLSLTILLFVSGLASFALGAYAAFVGEYAGHLGVAVLLLILVFAWMDSLHQQLIEGLRRR